MNIFSRICFRAGLVACLAGLLAAGPLFAQSSTESPTLIKHLRTELNARDDVRQERALIDVIALASCQESCTVSLQSGMNRAIRIANETGTGNVVDLDALAPDLVRAYRTGPADGHKLLALSALLNIGNEKALEQLIGEKDSQSANVQDVTNLSLVAFYLAKYPELTEQTMRRRSLTLDDVQRARVLRLRAARRAENGGGR